MIGAIIGDIVGSRFEWDNHRSKDFELFHDDCFFTDDSVMSIALCEAIMKSAPEYRNLESLAVNEMQKWGRAYPGRGYGGRFAEWLLSNNPQPYNSFGNGSAMRIGGCGFAAKTLDEAKRLSEAVTKVTHNHPEGLKGAEATAVAVFMARNGAKMDEIRTAIVNSYYALDFTLDQIRPTYQFNETCQDTVPQALQAFFESTGFEDAIRNAISVGGDSDTLAAITGSVAEAFWGVPQNIREKAQKYLSEELLSTLLAFEAWVS